MFQEGKLGDYHSFIKNNGGDAVLAQWGLSSEDCVRHMRILSLCSLAAEHEEIPYQVVADTLQTTSADVRTEFLLPNKIRAFKPFCYKKGFLLPERSSFKSADVKIASNLYKRLVLFDFLVFRRDREIPKYCKSGEMLFQPNLLWGTFFAIGEVIFDQNSSF